METCRRIGRNFVNNWKISLSQPERRKKSSEEKCAIALNLIGEEAFDLLDLSGLEEVDKRSYDTVIEAYEKYFTPKKNIVYERYVFYTRNQKENEPFDLFYAECRKLARNCEFVGGAQAMNELVRNRLVLGTVHPEPQEQLIRLKETTLDNVVLKSKLFGKNNEHLRDIQNGTLKQVEAIRRDRNRNKSNTEKVHRSRTHGSATFADMATRKGSVQRTDKGATNAAI